MHVCVSLKPAVQLAKVPYERVDVDITHEQLHRDLYAGVEVKVVGELVQRAVAFVQPLGEQLQFARLLDDV